MPFARSKESSVMLEIAWCSKVSELESATKHVAALQAKEGIVVAVAARDGARHQNSFLLLSLLSERMADSGNCHSCCC